MPDKNTFVPKLFATLKGYNKEQFVKDLLAGLIVGIVALPLAIAFAIASGVSPEKGIYTVVEVAREKQFPAATLSENEKGIPWS